jgi:hypothetical protein
MALAALNLMDSWLPEESLSLPWSVTLILVWCDRRIAQTSLAIFLELPLHDIDRSKVNKKQAIFL